MLKPIHSYTMKARLYPNKQQAESIDLYLLGAEKALNKTPTVIEAEGLKE